MVPDETDRLELLRAHNFVAEGVDYPIRRVLHMVSTGLDSDAAWLELPIADDTMVVSASRDLPEDWSNPCGISAETLSQAAPKEYPKLTARSARDRAFLQQSGARALVCYPLLGSDLRPFGVLVVSRHREGQINDNERKLVSDGVRVIEDILSLRADSIRDPLTGCYNRRYFEDQLSQELRRSLRTELPLTIAMIDVDLFKAYNDSAGHVAGDNALRRIGRALQESGRRAGDLICRVGGEEFALVLPSTTPENAQIVLKRVADAVRDLGIINSGNQDRPLTVSIGFTTVLTTDSSAGARLLDFVEHADQALYQAKSEGRDRVVEYRQAAVDKGAD